MTTFQKTRVLLAAFSWLLAFSASTNEAVSRIIATTNGTITMRSGSRTGLQQAFAWNERCRPVPVSFSGRATAGSLLRVGGVFRVLNGRCAGQRVNGFTVVYKAPLGYQGIAKVSYTLKAANNRNYFSFTRLMNIR